MKKYGLLGQHLSHSFSERFFTEKFTRDGISATYENIELPSEEAVAAFLKNNDFAGVNVTVPYKQAVIPYLDELSGEAAAIGAVNTIRFHDGKAIGYNTDAFGFHQSIKPFLTNLHERALILGTGGASKAVAYVFRNIGLDVLFVSRTPQGPKEFPYDAINEHMLRACKVVVNCTPVGMYPHTEDCVPFPFAHLTEEHLVIDLIYNPEQTVFLQKSAEHGAATLNGLSMLKEQALKAWEIWNEWKMEN